MGEIPETQFFLVNEVTLLGARMDHDFSFPCSSKTRIHQTWVSPTLSTETLSLVIVDLLGNLLLPRFLH